MDFRDALRRASIRGLQTESPKPSQVKSSSGTLYTAHTRPPASKMKAHKVFHDVQAYSTTWTPENLWRSAACRVLISWCLELAHVCKFPLFSQFVALQYYLPMGSFKKAHNTTDNRRTLFLQTGKNM